MIEPPVNGKPLKKEDKRRAAIAAADPDKEVELADLKRSRVAKEAEDVSVGQQADSPSQKPLSQKIADAKMSKPMRRVTAALIALFTILGLGIGLSLFYSGVIAAGYVVLMALGPLAIFAVGYGLFKGLGKVIGFFETLFDKVKKNKGLTAAIVLGAAAALILTLAFPALGAIFAPGLVGVIALGALAGIVPLVLYAAIKNPRVLAAIVGVGILATAIAFAGPLAAVIGGTFAFVLPALVFAAGAAFLLGSLYAMFTNKRDGKPRPAWQRTALALLGLGIIAGAGIMLAGVLAPGLALGAVFMPGIGGLIIAAGLAVVGPLVVFGLLAAIGKGLMAVPKLISSFANAITKRVEQLGKAARNLFAVVFFAAAIAVPIVAFLYFMPMLMGAGLPLMMALPMVALPALLLAGLFAALGRNCATFKLKRSHKAVLLVGLGAALAFALAPLGLGIGALLIVAAAPLVLAGLYIALGKVAKFFANVAKTIRKNPKTAAVVTISLLTTAAVLSVLLLAFPMIGAGPILLAGLGAFVVSALFTTLFVNRKEIGRAFSNMWASIKEFFGIESKSKKELSQEQEEDLELAQENTAEDADTLRQGEPQPGGSYLQPDGTRVFYVEDFGDDFLTEARRQEHGTLQTDGSYLQEDGTRTLFVRSNEELEDYLAGKDTTQGDTSPQTVRGGTIAEAPIDLASEEGATTTALSSDEGLQATDAETLDAKAVTTSGLDDVSQQQIQDERPEGVSEAALAAAKGKLEAELEKTEVKEKLLQGEIKLSPSVVKAIEEVSPKPTQSAPTPKPEAKRPLDKADLEKFVAKPLTKEERKAVAKILVEEGFKQSPIPIAPPSWLREACERAAERALKEYQETEQRAAMGNMQPAFAPAPARS